MMNGFIDKILYIKYTDIYSIRYIENIIALKVSDFSTTINNVTILNVVTFDGFVDIKFVVNNPEKIKDGFIIYNNRNKIHQIKIYILSNNDRYSIINKNDVITLSNDSGKSLNPIFYIFIGSDKQIISPDIKGMNYLIDLSNYNTDKNISILIKDGVYKQSFDIQYDGNKQIEHKYNIISEYSKGRTSIRIKSSFIHNINIIGDVVWSGIIDKEIVLYKNGYIDEFHIVNFEINGINFSETVIDIDKFPSIVSYSDNAFHLNKNNSHNLIIKINDIIIDTDNKSTIPYKISEQQNNTIANVYFGNILLCSCITTNIILPYLSVITKPIRFKISEKSLEDIHIKVRNDAIIYTIFSGETEVKINNLSKGLNTIIVDGVNKCISIKKAYIVIK